AGPGRVQVRRSGKEAGRRPGDHGSHYYPRRRRQWCAASRPRRVCEEILRQVRAPAYLRWHRAQFAPGGATGVCPGRHRRRRLLTELSMKPHLFVASAMLGAAVATPLGSLAAERAMHPMTSRETKLPVEGMLASLAGATAWLNSQPLTAEGLRGKVVLVDFWTYTCINWQRTQPYVRYWAEKYKDQGLVVIGVHTPGFGFERDVDNIRSALKMF